MRRPSGFTLDRVASDSHDVVTKVIDQAIAQIAAPDVLAVNDWRYRAHYLYSTDAAHPAVTAAVVLAGEQSVPALRPAPLLQLMAERLRQMRETRVSRDCRRRSRAEAASLTVSLTDDEVRYNTAWSSQS